MHGFGQKTQFYGTATVGTKGQIVIPADAREQLNIKEGDKLVVIGIPHQGMLAVCPVSGIESMLGELTAKLDSIREVIDKTKKEL